MTLDELDLPLQAVAAAMLLYIPKLLSALFLFFAGLWLSGWAARITARSLKSRGTDPEISLLLSRVARITVLVLASVGALQQVEFDLTGFVAGLGIVGFTIGFALQDVSKNFIAGLLLLMQQPFDIGDAIEVSGTAGVVTGINLRATEIRTFDGLVVLIPNTDVYIKVVKKFGRELHRRIKLTVVANSPDFQAVRLLVREGLREVPGALIDEDPSPKIVVHAVDAETSSLVVYFWVDFRQARVLTAQEAALGAVRSALDQGGISTAKMTLGPPWSDTVGGVGEAGLLRGGAE